MGDFTEGSRRRIAKAVKRLEHTPRDNVGVPPVRRAMDPARRFWAKISSSALSSGIYRHAWAEQVRSGDTFAARTGGLSGTTSADYIVAPDGRQIPNNTYVLVVLEFDGGVARWTAVSAWGLTTTLTRVRVTSVQYNTSTKVLSYSYVTDTDTYSFGLLTSSSTSGSTTTTVDTAVPCS